GTFSTAQVPAGRQILSVCEGVVRWGGDYKSRADEMHFEINAGAAAGRGMADTIRNQHAAQEAELSQQQVDQLRRDIGFARDQIMTHLGKRPDRQPLPAAQLANVEVARRVDVGYARDQMLAEFASVKHEQEEQRKDLEELRGLLEAIAEKVRVPP